MGYSERLTAYCRNGGRGVEGWISMIDLEIFRTLLSQDAVRGACVEIGVHHGKTFLILLMANEGKACYAIDIFDQQHLNVDKSGRGDREILERNMASHGFEPGQVTIDARSSQEVTPADILDSVGPARFFHIDGGHHFEAVTSDFRLADKVLADDGVIAVDDALRGEWPDVARGMFYAIRELDLQIFAFGPNKAYICRLTMVKEKQRVLATSQLLPLFISKAYRTESGSIFCFQRNSATYGLMKAMGNVVTQSHPHMTQRLARAFAPSLIENRKARMQKGLA